mmetsp:Transcript_23674/g.66470  ORF Transcript_23674/g.66470 Transcript_23674/m.66470 type:complete len:215 (+) Transcript_23674:1937-2581(+)
MDGHARLPAERGLAPPRLPGVRVGELPGRRPAAPGARARRGRGGRGAAAERARGGDPRGRPQEVEANSQGGVRRQAQGRVLDVLHRDAAGARGRLGARGARRGGAAVARGVDARPREEGGRGRCHRRRRRRAVRGYRRRSARRDTDGRVPEPDRGLRAAPARAATGRRPDHPPARLRRGAEALLRTRRPAPAEAMAFAEREPRAPPGGPGEEQV